MAYETTPQYETELSSFNRDLAELLGGMSALGAGAVFQRYEIVTDSDGQEYMGIVSFSPHDL